jgi:hypothetical protein
MSERDSKFRGKEDDFFPGGKKSRQWNDWQNLPMPREYRVGLELKKVARRALKIATRIEPAQQLHQEPPEYRCYIKRPPRSGGL